MLRSMFSGVSGLRLHQTRMDVIGNNIANVNTVAYKSSRITFQEIYSQTLRPASAPLPDGSRGGTNPFQVGLGIGISSMDVLHLNGSAQRTDRVMDLAIEGDGFFVVSDGSGQYYTRAGNFDIDRAGTIVTASGMKVLGWVYNHTQGTMETTGLPREINLSNLVLPPKATENIRFEGNLDSRAETGTIVPYTASIIDAKGQEHKIQYEFVKAAENNVWNYTVTAPPGVTLTQGASGVLRFNDAGRLISPDASPPAVPSQVPEVVLEIGGTDSIQYQAHFTEDKFTYYSGDSSLKVTSVDGYRLGVLSGITIDSSGSVIGIYNNGQFRTEAVLALARFTNPGGLLKGGDNLFLETTNSGFPELGPSGTDGRGSINPGALEMSNVDLAKEFTDMISTQRGFQANSRIITTSDELLQELVNLKR